MTICRNIAAALGGAVAVESSLGSGSTFTLILPLVRAGDAIGEVRTDLRDLRSSSVLILDDNPLAQAMLRALLSDKVARLEFASSPTDVHSALDNGFVECVVIDGACLVRQFPEDPMTAIRSLTARSTAPFCVLWPGLDENIASQLLSAGVRCVLAKPVAGAILVQQLEACMDQAHKLGDAPVAKVA